MFTSDWFENLSHRLGRPQDQIRLRASMAEHTRNGRGFWPVVEIDGQPLVVRFAVTDGDPGARWTPETGMVDVVALHALSPCDWPRVRMG